MIQFHGFSRTWNFFFLILGFSKNVATPYRKCRVGKTPKKESKYFTTIMPLQKFRILAIHDQIRI